MPPKKKVVASNYILKFKNNKITYILSIEESELSLSNIKSKLLSVINESGGIQEDIPNGDEDDIPVPKSEFDEDNIPVPKSEFDEDNIPVEDDEMKIEDNQVIKPEISIDDLRIAIARDITQPYNNEWVEITSDDQLNEIQFKDYLIFAFTIDDKFNIIEAAYEE